MGNINLKFEPKDDRGSNLGDYEMFIDLSSTEQNPTSIMLEVPDGWLVRAIKFYAVTENPNGTVTPSQEKKADIRTLKGAGKSGNFGAVFDNITTPEGFSFDATSKTLTDNGASKGAFEYLIWIQVSGSDTNDFIDPGIRNH